MSSGDTIPIYYPFTNHLPTQVPPNVLSLPKPSWWFFKTYLKFSLPKGIIFPSHETALKPPRRYVFTVEWKIGCLQGRYSRQNNWCDEYPRNQFQACSPAIVVRVHHYLQFQSPK